MIDRVDVALGDRSYPIHIQDGLIDEAGTRLRSFAREGKLTIVSDENVWAAQGERLTAALRASNVRPQPIVIAAGEGSKSWQGLKQLLDHLFALELERTDHIVAFGGGMIGDLVGLAASLMKRGCPFVQIPTSLLAQVDSSVGGKTAINVDSGKNLVGAFHQPSLVLIDPSCLDTLPAREVSAGFAEVVKYGLIDRPDFFGWCEGHGAELVAGDPAARHFAIATSVAAKAEIVGADERETKGRRALLNLGHTFGHALEAETGFSDRLLHGEAVAAGMALAFRFSAATGRCSARDADRVTACLRRVGLPTSQSEAGIEASGRSLADRMKQDKKASGGVVPFILPSAIGAVRVIADIQLKDVASFLEDDRRQVDPQPRSA